MGAGCAAISPRKREAGVRTLHRHRHDRARRAGYDNAREQPLAGSFRHSVLVPRSATARPDNGGGRDQHRRGDGEGGKPRIIGARLDPLAQHCTAAGSVAQRNASPANRRSAPDRRHDSRAAGSSSPARPSAAMMPASTMSAVSSTRSRRRARHRSARCLRAGRRRRQSADGANQRSETGRSRGRGGSKASCRSRRQARSR